MKDVVTDFLGCLAEVLPIMLAEDDSTHSVPRDALIVALANVTPPEQSEILLAAVERVFCALALLHPGLLAEGQWRFNSYAGWLVGRSLLETLKTPHHSIFDPGYWSSSASDIEVDEQRDIIGRMERARVAYHPANAAKPIRFVYVAWAVIRLGDSFLLYAREDKVRPDSRGDFGFPGGRFKLSDVPLFERPATAERDIAYGVDNWPMRYLDRSLYRELREELELSHIDHYSLGPPLDITPYQKIEGARNHFSYTEYRMRIFPIQLNRHGVVRLLERLDRNPELFGWFNAADLEAERNARGQRAFVSALVEHFGPGLRGLVELPSAISESFLQNTPHIGIDIPLSTKQPIKVGRSGKSLKDHFAFLTDAELGWLWALAWHAKALPLSKSQAQGTLPLGWVKIEDKTHVLSLRDKLDRAGLPLVEVESERYFRLSINPRMIYFDPAFFRYRLHGNRLKGTLELFSVGIETPFGTLKHDNIFIELSTTLVGEIRHLAGVELLADHTHSSEHLRRMIDAALGDATKAMGIRQLISQVDKARQYRQLLIAPG